VEGKPQQLIETVAERIAAAILQDHRLVRAARVHVSKPHVSLPGPLESVQVEIIRWRQDARQEKRAVDC
jgi:7,8-dihydroneopterin aldolase/epimerase/oxygenase